MMIHRNRFNTYLALAAALTLAGGCGTTKKKTPKPFATLRVNLETNADSSGRNKPVPIYRENPFMLTIETDPILTEANISEARVIETVGGFALRLRFERKGRWLLEQYTAANHGKHVAIFSEFTSPTAAHVNIGRWLGAPLITGRIQDGVLLFTPDVSIEEAHQIAIGLNNIAKKNENTPEDEAKRIE